MSRWLQFANLLPIAIFGGLVLHCSNRNSAPAFSSAPAASSIERLQPSSGAATGFRQDLTPESPTTVQARVERGAVDEFTQHVPNDDSLAGWNKPGTQHRGVGRGKWLQSQGVPDDDSLGDICYTTGLVGVPPAPSLMCLDLTEPKWRQDGALLYIGHIWSIRDKQPHNILDTPIAAGPGDPLSEDGRYYVKLLIQVSADGTTLAITDSHESSCAEAAAKVANVAKKSNIRASKAKRLNDEVCNARGTYIWKSGRYRRQNIAYSAHTSGP